MQNQTFSDVKYRSPIVRFGGKYFLADWIVSKIPQHTVYVEPFAGAGHVLFAKSESKCEVLNDTDGNLVNFFRVIKNHATRQRLIVVLNHMPYSRECWQELRLKQKAGDTPRRSSQKRSVIEQRLRLSPELSDRQIAKESGVSDKTVGSVRKELERIAEIPQCSRKTADGRIYPSQRSESKTNIIRAAEFLYMNRSTFGGDMQSGGFASPSVTGRNPVQSFRNAVDSLNDVSERLRNACIENLNYQECIKKYDSKDSLFFCDPPYLTTEHYYGEGNFTHDDHRALADLLHKIKGKAMVTHYQNDLYDELYRDWRRYEYSSFKGSHKSDTGETKPQTVEILYCNFEPEIKTRNLFQGMN